jgi:hypothetical protein
MEIKEEELNELLEAHLQKSEKVGVYAPRVKANIINGVPVFKATWDLMQNLQMLIKQKF